uniref:F-box domain, leucine-rich repeat domain, L domain-like protein n=1 Tax=Tanacetum cinerariifolium TaxID=118510 RepID=A0A6L2KHT8_TANCI|nr:hypothetical protein [Tanacetum cinerariifolium]
MESSATREYPSLIHTFFLTRTVGDVFLNPKDKALYGLGFNTPSGVPYTDDEIMVIVYGSKQWGHIPDVGRVLSGQGTIIPPSPSCTHSSDVAKLKMSEKLLTKQVNMFMKLFRSDDKFSQMLTQLESQPEYGGGSGSGGCGNDEQEDDEDGGEDGEDEDNSLSWATCRRGKLKQKNIANLSRATCRRRKMESSATREYLSLSLIHTFFLTHIVGDVFLNPKDKALYDEMLRLQGLGFNTPSGVPYTDDEIMVIVHGSKQWGHIPSVGRVLPGQGTIIPPSPSCTHSSDVAKLKMSEKLLTKQVNMFMKLFRSDDKFSQMLTQLESQPEYGGGSGSGGCGNDEPKDDEDGSEDGEDEDNS